MDKSLILNEIKKHLGYIKDADFADFLEIKPNVLSNWKKRNTYDVELIYTKCDFVNPHWLLTNGKGKMLKKENATNTLNALSSSKMPEVITVDNSGNENILHVPVKAQAGYLESFNNPVFLEQLPAYKFPNLTNGTYRMFDVEGFSMLPTLHNDSKVIGQFVENWATDIKDDRVYVVVSKEGVVVKRCLNRIEKYGTLFCKSDNRKEYPNYPVKLEDIKEVWEVKIAFVYNLPNPADLFDRINDLEAKVMNLETKF